MFLLLGQRVRILTLIVKLNRQRIEDNAACSEDIKRKVMDEEGSWESVIFSRTFRHNG